MEGKIGAHVSRNQDINEMQKLKKLCMLDSYEMGWMGEKEGERVREGRESYL